MLVQEHSYANNLINLLYPRNSSKKAMLIIYITSFCCLELHKAIMGLKSDFLEYYCDNIWIYIR